MNDARTTAPAEELSALEREVARLPGVEAARVVTDADGQLTEVHVVSSTEHHPKRTVRDIQTLARSSFDLDLDHRMISVARLGDRSDPVWRPVLRAVLAERRGVHWVVEVTVEQDGREFAGAATGSSAGSSRLQAAAHATLEALRRLVPALAVADVETPIVVSTFHREIVLVTVVFGIDDREEATAGSAIVGEAGDVEAVVRAVLDATTRRSLALLPT
jgi:hypothetical protein